MKTMNLFSKRHVALGAVVGAVAGLLIACGQGDIWEPSGDGYNGLSQSECERYGISNPGCSLEDDVAAAESDTWINTGNNPGPGVSSQIPGSSDEGTSSDVPFSSEGGDPGFSSDVPFSSETPFSSQGGYSSATPYSSQAPYSSQIVVSSSSSAPIVVSSSSSAPIVVSSSSSAPIVVSSSSQGGSGGGVNCTAWSGNTCTYNPATTGYDCAGQPFRGTDGYSYTCAIHPYGAYCNSVPPPETVNYGGAVWIKGDICN